nr:long-chain fatty acid--CoA ligase [Bacteroidia bacterium]
LKKWCERSNINYTSNQEMITQDIIIQKIQKQVDVTNKGLAHFEQIKAFALLPNEWSIENEELTPKLSLKRKVILKNYDKEIQNIYRSEVKI